MGQERAAVRAVPGGSHPRRADHRVRPDLLGLGVGRLGRVPVLRVRTSHRRGRALRPGSELRARRGPRARDRREPSGLAHLELHRHPEQHGPHRIQHAVFGDGAPHAGQQQQHLRRLQLHADDAAASGHRRQLLRKPGVRDVSREHVPAELRQLQPLRRKHEHRLHADGQLPPGRNLRCGLHVRRRRALPSLRLERGRIQRLDARRIPCGFRGAQP